jgi:predicted neutral ceramidase superfamily lipid hydrolase
MVIASTADNYKEFNDDKTGRCYKVVSGYLNTVSQRSYPSAAVALMTNDICKVQRLIDTFCLFLSVQRQVVHGFSRQEQAKQCLPWFIIGLWCSIFSFRCRFWVDHYCPFIPFLLTVTIVLSDLPRFTTSAYPFVILTLFQQTIQK